MGKAFLDAYGFSAKKDLPQQLLDLNHVVADRETAGNHVAALGIPPSYTTSGGDPVTLITDDCIQSS